MLLVRSSELRALFSLLLLAAAARSQPFLEQNFPRSIVEDAHLRTDQLIVKYKYPLEIHYVTTADGYILQLHRMPLPGGKPVLMVHGITASSLSWLLTGPQNGLGYYLFNNGYDVWLGNVRGNRYSRNHTKWDPNNDAAYWAFSWHEIGLHDVPTMVDHVLQQTNHSKLAYYGHSQGTTAFWIMTSLRPEYNAKISIMSALAPVAFLKNIKTPLLPLARNALAVVKGMVHELVPQNDIYMQLCFQSKASLKTCMDLVWLTIGRNPKGFNKTLLPMLFNEIPSGCSTRQLLHFIQLIDSGMFRQYDFGTAGNQKRYDRATPPDYPLAKITAPVALYYTRNDLIASDVDSHRLARSLPNVVEDRLYPHKAWNHMDMMWSIDVRILAHERMLEVMRRFE